MIIKQHCGKYRFAEEYTWLYLDFIWKALASNKSITVFIDDSDIIFFLRLIKPYVSDEVVSRIFFGDYSKNVEDWIQKLATKRANAVLLISEEGVNDHVYHSWFKNKFDIYGVDEIISVID